MIEKGDSVLGGLDVSSYEYRGFLDSGCMGV